MNNINIISEILNLNLKKYKIVNYINEKENILEFHIIWKSKYCNCPQCGLKTNKRQDLKEYKQKKNLKHIILSDWKMIELKPIKRFFRCTNCKSHFLEKFDFESKNWLHTLDFERYVISSWGVFKLTKNSRIIILKSLKNISYFK